jgi:hypothetical protein
LPIAQRVVAQGARLKPGIGVACKGQRGGATVGAILTEARETLGVQNREIARDVHELHQLGGGKATRNLGQRIGIILKRGFRHLHIPGPSRGVWPGK